MIWGFCCVWVFLDALYHRRLRISTIAAIVLPFIVLVGAHYLWRYSYYGDWLPNTWYAKYVRPWPEAGAR